MLEAKLVVVGGDAKQNEIRLKTLPTIIGRGRDVTLTLPHPLVSRKHCEIFEKQGYLYVKDLQSLNGTYVNNLKIEDERILEPNQLLTLGNVTFRAVYHPDDVDAPVSADANDETFRVTSRPTTPDRAPVRDQSDLETEPLDIDQMDTDYDDPPIDDRETVRQDPAAQIQHQAAVKQAAPQTKPAGYSDTDELSKILIEDEANLAAEKSVSLSAIDGLPDKPAGASFAGGIEVDGEASSASSADPESVQIDVGQETPKTNNPSESALDSFFRKLPK